MTAPTVVLPADAGRDEWLAARRKGLGGSDAAAVAGLSPYAGPWSVWADKVGLDVPDLEPSEAMRWGTLLEPVISVEAGERFGLDVRPSPGLVANPQLGWQLATPDGLVGDDALLEVKNVGARQADVWETGPPDMYWAQGLHYVAVTGRATVHFVALVGGQRLVHHPVTYTPADVEGLTKIEADFWAHVEAETPPPAWPADIDALGRLDVDPDESVELDPNVLSLLADYDTASSAAKRKAEIADELKALLGTAAVGTVDGMAVVTWKTVRTDRLDSKALAAAHPDLAAEFVRTQTSRRLHMPKQRQEASQG